MTIIEIYYFIILFYLENIQFNFTMMNFNYINKIKGSMQILMKKIPKVINEIAQIQYELVPLLTSKFNLYQSDTRRLISGFSIWCTI